MPTPVLSPHLDSFVFFLFCFIISAFYLYRSWKHAFVFCCHVRPKPSFGSRFHAPYCGQLEDTCWPRTLSDPYLYNNPGDSAGLGWSRDLGQRLSTAMSASATVPKSGPTGVRLITSLPTTSDISARSIKDLHPPVKRRGGLC